MGKFRQFFLEFTALRSPFAGGTQHSGYFNLPDLKNIYQPGETPAGGFQNFSQLAQHNIDRARYSNKDTYIMVNTLEKLKRLAEEVMSAIALRDNPQVLHPDDQDYRRDYHDAFYNAQYNIIGGLTKQQLEGGRIELKNEEIQKGVQLRIIHIYNDYYYIYIQFLRQEMEKMQEILYKQEKGYKAFNYLAGQADHVADTIASGGQVGLGKNVNPLSGH